ncbi:MAG: HAD family hydrolase [Proteocatella sp.]
MEHSRILPINKKYILFDLDGTLTDPFMGITQSVQYALEHFNIKVEDLHQLSRFIGPPLKMSFQEYYKLTEEQSEKAVKKYRERFSDIGIFENEIYEGIKDMLEELIENGKVILMATSKPEAYAKRIADFFDLTQYFTQICGSEFDGRRQDKAEVIQLLMENQMIEDKAQVIMIGDRKHDIIGANKTEIESIGVAYGYGGNAELKEAGATYIVNSVAELRELLTKRFR